MQEDGAKEKYHEAQQAYETLSNKQNRATYDQVPVFRCHRCICGLPSLTVLQPS